MSERAMEVWELACEEAMGSACGTTDCDECAKAAAIIAQALAGERKARDAEICAWLRALTPEQMGWQYFGEFDEDARTALADAIERGDV